MGACALTISTKSEGHWELHKSRYSPSYGYVQKNYVAKFRNELRENIVGDKFLTYDKV